MRFVTDHFKVINTKILNFLDFSLKDDFWKRFWISLQLSLERLHMVKVDMGVTECVNEVPGQQVTHVSDHDGEQGVAGDVEGHAEPHVCRPLVQLAGQLTTRHIELDQAVTRRQRHLVQVCRVPGAHDDPPVVRLRLDPVDDLGQLVHPLAAVVGRHVDVLGSEVSPLEAVHGAEVSLLPLGEADAVEELSTAVPVPDPHILLLQLLRVSRASDEPEELLSDASVENFLGCEQRERSIPERISHLSSKERESPRASPVVSLHSWQILRLKPVLTIRSLALTCLYYSPDEVEVLEFLVFSAPLLSLVMMDTVLTVRFHTVGASIGRYF